MANYIVCLLVSQVYVKSITADTRNFHEVQWKLLGYLQVPDASLLVFITADRSLAKTHEVQWNFLIFLYYFYLF